MDRRIAFLQDQFLNNLQHQWTVEEMASTVEVSIPHLQKVFKDSIGIPPITYLRELRLEKARELLEKGFQNITEIRHAVGIHNDSHFTRDFKQKYGVTPTEYRRQLGEKNETKTFDDKK